MRKHSSSIHSPLPGEVCGEALPSFLLYQIRVREQACWINNLGKRSCHAPCFEEEAAPEIAVMLDKKRNSGEIPGRGEEEMRKGESSLTETFFPAS
jgi:hypothetical protein